MATTVQASQPLADGFLGKRSRRKKPKSERASWKEALLGYALASPAMLVFITFYYLPAIFLAYIAFFNWNLFGGDSHFVGFENFTVLFNQPLFWKALLLTGYYVIVMVPALAIVSLGLALLLREGWERRRGGFVRAMVFLPHVTPIVGTAIIWLWVFNPQFGIANAILVWFHLPALDWLLSTTWALPSVMIYGIWHDVGLYTMLFLAGLAVVPSTLIEAAKMDGARPWRVFRRIILPMISPTTFFVVVLATINSLQSFSQIYTLTGGQYGGGGGPAFSTTTAAVLNYLTVFSFQKYSLGSAMSLVLFVLLMGITILQKVIGDRFVFYR
jgi:multiple sugar transport system permease protein